MFYLRLLSIIIMILEQCNLVWISPFVSYPAQLMEFPKLQPSSILPMLITSHCIPTGFRTSKNTVPDFIRPLLTWPLSLIYVERLLIAQLHLASFFHQPSALSLSPSDALLPLSCLYLIFLIFLISP